MKMNKKGFTLVELLAVIVILAVVMLIGVTAVGPLMEKARKNTLGDEGLSLITAAQTAYQAEQLGGTITPHQSVCFSLAWLKSKGYYQKEATDYHGSVKVTATKASSTDSSDKIVYEFLIANSGYMFATPISATKFSSEGAGDLATVYSSGSNVILDQCGSETKTSAKVGGVTTTTITIDSVNYKYLG